MALVAEKRYWVQVVVVDSPDCSLMVVVVANIRDGSVVAKVDLEHTEAVVQIPFDAVAQLPFAAVAVEIDLRNNTFQISNNKHTTTSSVDTSPNHLRPDTFEFVRTYRIIKKMFILLLRLLTLIY